MTQELIPHDAYLKSIVIEWRVGAARLELGYDETAIVIRASGLQGLHLPRKEPWGPSDWINSVQGPVNEPQGAQRLMIEMQSGDVIEVVAREISVERMPEDKT
jgi:hypothetical protein